MFIATSVNNLLLKDAFLSNAMEFMIVGRRTNRLEYLIEVYRKMLAPRISRKI